METLAKLLRQNKQLVERLDNAALYLYDEQGRSLYGELFEHYGEALAAVLRSPAHLKELAAVLEDAVARFLGTSAAGQP